jgi:ribonucleoside-triphosphate reductase
MESVLRATEEGLGNGETPIFPIQIFKVKEGVSFNPEDPNYDLFKMACKVSAKRLFPNFSFLDAPFNKQYLEEGNPATECAYMGCRTRVIGNVHDPSREVVNGRGNLSFTSINLPRLAIKAKGDLDMFFEGLDHMIDLTCDQLYDRFKIQSKKKVRNFPFLMGQGIWIDSETLGPDDTIEEVIKHGTLTVGFIGLAECLKALTGKHHGESKEAQILGQEIVGYMRKRMDEYVAVCKRVSDKYGCIFIDFQQMFEDYCKIRHSSYIAWDRIHPNQVGATLMAKEFLKKCDFDYSL